MLHPVFVRRADVENLHAVGSGFGDRFDYALHLRVSRVMIADIVAQNALRARHFSAIFAARVKVEFFLGLREIYLSKRAKQNGKQKAFDFHF